MKLSVDRKALSEALATVAHALPPRSSMPILGHVLLTAEPGRLRLACTQLELSIAAEIAADVEAVGQACPTARFLLDLAKSLAGERIELGEAPAGRLAVRCADHTSKVGTLEPDDFPQLPEASGKPLATIPAAALRDGVARTIHAVLDNASRPSLHALCFSFRDGKLTLVGADGFRPGRLDVGSVVTGGAGLQRDVLVPLPAARELARALGSADDGAEVALYLLGDRQDKALFRLPGGMDLAASLFTDCAYPAWAQLIPTPDQVELRASVEAGKLARATRSALLFAREGAIAKLLRVELRPDGPGGQLGELVVSASGLDKGEVVETITCSVTGRAGKPVAFGVQGEYLLEAVEACPSESLFLDVQSPSRPTVLREAGGDSWLEVVMPMNLSKDTEKAAEKAAAEAAA